MSIPFVQKGAEWFSNHLSDIGTVKKPNRPVAQMCATERFIDTEPSTQFFTNDTVGIAMNQDVSFGSVAVTLHDGGTSTNGESGTADTDTTNHVIQAGQDFQSTVVVGSVVHVGANFATVTVVNSNTDLTCDSDICPNGNEAYTIDDVWVGTAVQGTWNFADSAKITLTSGDNNDEASIDGDTLASLDFDNFTALTGKVDLDTYSSANTTIVVRFDSDGVIVGNTVNLDDFIDTGDFTEQSFAIPKAAFGLSSQTVNGITFIVQRSAGAKPTFKLDDLQLEASGDPLIFSLDVDRQEIFHIHELIFTYVDGIDSISTVAGATENVTNIALDYNAILGVAALTNGFIINRSKAGKTLFNVTIRTLGQHIAAGAKREGPVTAPDGTSTMLVLRVVFEDPLLLTGDNEDTLTIQINDPMNGLLQFTAAARGSIETLSKAA